MARNKMSQQTPSRPPSRSSTTSAPESAPQPEPQPEPQPNDDVVVNERKRSHRADPEEVIPLPVSPEGDIPANQDHDVVDKAAAKSLNSTDPKEAHLPATPTATVDASILPTGDLATETKGPLPATPEAKVVPVAEKPASQTVTLPEPEPRAEHAAPSAPVDDDNNDNDDSSSSSTDRAARLPSPKVVPAPRLDHAAETYYSQCVQNPHAEFYIDYPARIYHVKSQLGESRATASHPRSLGDWQSTLLWQPVLPLATGSDAEDEEQANKQLFHRPMTDFDRLAMPHFVWFCPYGSISTSNPEDQAGEDFSSSSSSQAPAPNHPRLGFRPHKDILLLDTPFLETYLGTYDPSPSSPFSPSFFPFLPPTPSARAPLKILYLSAEPLRKATYLTDAQLETFDDEDNNNGAAACDNMIIDEGTRNSIRRRQRRRRHELRDMCLRRRTLARMLVAVFPGLQRIQLVEMARVQRPSQRNIVEGQFAKWGNLEAAITAEHYLFNRTTTPAPASFQQGHNPRTVLYRRALEWGLITPRWDDIASPTFGRLANYEPALSLSRMFVEDIFRARDEVVIMAKWREEYERERADPALVNRRRARHRRIGFSRRMPERPQKKEKEQETLEKKQRKDVKAESVIMMYFEDKLNQAREAGWTPGELLDVRHLF